MRCYFHHADLDGFCSGAIIKSTYPECEMYGINYGNNFPFKLLTNPLETVFMVDFTLQPFTLMHKLNNICKLIWIDHHKTEIETAELENFNPFGLREIGRGACELTWEYIYPEKDVPYIIELLSQYDVWNHTNPDVLPFQYRMRMEDLNPNTEIGMKNWKYFFELNKYRGPALDQFVEEGNLLLRYEEQQNKKFCQAAAFETILIFEEKKWKCIAANRSFSNSKLFDSVYDPKRHDLMLMFKRERPPKNSWSVSLYSTKEGIDCGQIARLFGGGGHLQASGFNIKELPFDY